MRLLIHLFVSALQSNRCCTGRARGSRVYKHVSIEISNVYIPEFTLDSSSFLLLLVVSQPELLLMFPPLFLDFPNQGAGLSDASFHSVHLVGDVVVHLFQQIKYSYDLRRWYVRQWQRW